MLIRDQTPENEIHKIEKIYYSKPLESWIPVKENKEKKLLPFQTDVLSKLNTPLQYKKKVLLHLDTGLGKTFITLNLINQNRDKYLDKSVPILIIAPASNLIDPWCNEIDDLNRNQDRKYKYYVYHGAGKDILKVKEELHLEGFDFVLISYQTLESDSCNDYFFSKQFNLIIYDEPQTIINPTKENATLMKLENVSGKRRLALTASPLSNSINELFILTTLLNNPENIGYAYFELKTLKDRNELTKRCFYNTEIISLSKFKEKVIEQTNMQPIYEYIFVLPVPEIVKEKLYELNSTAQRTLCLQIPEYYIKNPPPDITFDSKTKTAELILSLIPKTQKTIVFSMYTRCLNKLHRLLSKQYDCFKVVGGMSKKERIRVVNNFKAFKRQAIMLASLKANSTGLNYQEANNIIFLDPWYNPEAMKQARDRCFRMGQKNITNVFYLMTDTDHEINITRIKETKTGIKKAVFPLEDGPNPKEIHVYSNENYLELIEGYMKNEVLKKSETNDEKNDFPEPIPFKVAKKDTPLNINFMDSSEE